MYDIMKNNQRTQTCKSTAPIFLLFVYPYMAAPKTWVMFIKMQTQKIKTKVDLSTPVISALSYVYISSFYLSYILKFIFVVIIWNVNCAFHNNVISCIM